MNPLHQPSQLESEIVAICREVVHPTIDAETRLIEEGLLDSFLTLKLMSRIEDAYSIEVELSTLEADQVASPKAIAAYVAAARKAEDVSATPE